MSLDSILQNVVESGSLVFRLTLTVEEAEALKLDDVNMVNWNTIILMEARMEEQLSKVALRVFEVCPGRRVELLCKVSESKRALVASGFLLILGCNICTLDKLGDFDSVEGQGLLELHDRVI